MTKNYYNQYDNYLQPNSNPYAGSANNYDNYANDKSTQIYLQPNYNPLQKYVQKNPDVGQYQQPANQQSQVQEQSSFPDQQQYYQVNNQNRVSAQQPSVSSNTQNFYQEPENDNLNQQYSQSQNEIYQEALQSFQNNPKPTKRIPVRTGDSNDRLQLLQSKYLGKNFNGPSQPSSSIVPVRVSPRSNQTNPISPSREFLSNLSNYSGQNETFDRQSDRQNKAPRPAQNSNSRHFPAPNIYTQDFPLAPLNNKKRLSKPNGLDTKWYLPEKNRSKKGFRKFVVAAGMVAMIFVSLFGWNFYKSKANQEQSPVQAAQVAGVQEEKEVVEKIEEYTAWVKQQNQGEFLEPDADQDTDGLTNYEEFLLTSSPINPNTCTPDKTDAQVLLELHSPVDCKPLNLEDQKVMETLTKIIDIKEVQQNFAKTASSAPAPGTNPENQLLSVFGIADYKELNDLTTETIDQQANLIEQKKQYLNLVKRIEAYIQKYRSYDPIDRNYAVPVHAATYLEVSLQYNVPLKYVLAIARKESRFGTDRYTNNGNFTRPGQYQNIYSMGLDDSGNNIKFESWEEGVHSFGRWYKRFNDQGISDCRKWRIYNPNGDYCSEIEKLATEIDYFLK